MELSATNKFIMTLMHEDSVLFPIFSLFANGIVEFSEVLKIAENAGIDFKNYVESRGFDYNIIKEGL